MSYIANFDQSNKADWAFDIIATDSDGNAVDFTGASVSFAIKDESGCPRLTASIGGGITQPTVGTLEFLFDKDQMASLCPGAYSVGCVYELNGETNQLFVGTVSIYDGVAAI